MSGSKDDLREKFLRLGMESTRKSYYPQLKSNLEIVKDNERHLKLLLDNLPARISYVNTDEVYVSVNKVYSDVLGVSSDEIIGHKVRDVIGDENYAIISPKMDQAFSGKKQTFEMPFKVSDEKEYWVEENFIPDIDKKGRVAGFFVLAVDLTEKKHIEEERGKLEKRMLQAQKMESLGTLAGGIAHDFNNILSPLMGFAELLKEDLPDDSPLHEYVEEILKATFRSKELVQQILTFSRQDEKEVVPLKLQPILKEALKFMRSSIPSVIEILSDIDTSCGIVLADPTQIHQIIINLMTNSFHAMETKGGVLKVSLREIEVLRGDQGFTKIVPGRYALLKVTDTGTGIPKKIIDKVFDPYFTTKEKNKGTGLGLSLVQSIVKSFNGEIKIYSEFGIGTEMSIYLPIHSQREPGIELSSKKKIRRGTEKILVVDDEASVLKMEELMLTRLGYTVTPVLGATDALKLVINDPHQFDLVMSDVTMPAMTGLQMAEEIKHLRPDMPIILCSGFSEKLSEEVLKKLDISGFVMKPLIQSDLAQALSNALDKK